MKKKYSLFWSAAAFTGCLIFCPLTSYADINGNEAELLSIINSTREYNGVMYQVDQQYRDAARAYLDDPSIDCTDEQKQKAINQMFGSIQQGIDEGYLVPVGGGSAQKAGNAASDAGAAGDAAQADTAQAGTPQAGAAQSDTSQANTSQESTAQAGAVPAGAGDMQAGAGNAPAESEGDAAAAGMSASGEAAGSTDAAQIVTESESVPQETEPSPIVLALEQAMNTPQETSKAMAAGSLLPEVVYPSRLINVFAIGAAAAAVFAAAASFYMGLFHHHHSRRQK